MLTVASGVCVWGGGGGGGGLVENAACKASYVHKMLILLIKSVSIIPYLDVNIQGFNVHLYFYLFVITFCDIIAKNCEWVTPFVKFYSNTWIMTRDSIFQSN